MTDFESHGIEERQNSPLVRPTTTFFLISFFQYSMYFIRILSHVMFNIFYPVFLKKEEHLVRKDTYRHKTIYRHFYFIIPQANQNQLLCSLLKMVNF